MINHNLGHFVRYYCTIFGLQVGIRWNEHKDHSGGSVEMKMQGEGGAFFAVSSMWEETNLMDAGHELDHTRILTEMMSLDRMKDVLKMRRTNTSVPHVRRAFTRCVCGGGFTYLDVFT